jgi:hypothetical protein
MYLLTIGTTAEKLPYPLVMYTFIDLCIESCMSCQLSSSQTAPLVFCFQTKDTVKKIWFEKPHFIGVFNWIREKAKSFSGAEINTQLNNSKNNKQREKKGKF